MKNGRGEFYELLPRGVDLEEETSDTTPVLDGQFVEIETSRRDFLYHCGFDTSRPMVNKSRFCCKVAFIIRELPSIYQPDVLFALLSDRTTLFSASYANYQHNHAFVKDQSKGISADSENKLRFVRKLHGIGM